MFDSLEDYGMRLEVAGSDFLLFTTSCCCHHEEGTRLVADEIIRQAKAKKVTKVALKGGCSDIHPKPLDWFLKTLEEEGLELVWFDRNGLSEFVISKYIVPFTIQIRTWEDVKAIDGTLGHLVAAARRVNEMQERIENEGKLLSQYPLICKIGSIEWHPGNLHNSQLFGGQMNEFADLFQPDRQDVVSRTQAVALFDPETFTGVLMAKARAIRFEVVENYRYGGSENFANRLIEGLHEPSHGSLRIRLKGGQHQISLYVLKGQWTIKPHPEVDPSNPEIKFVPMWQRIEKVEAIQPADKVG
jgi:hypothetical protein